MEISLSANSFIRETICESVHYVALVVSNFYHILCQFIAIAKSLVVGVYWCVGIYDVPLGAFAISIFDLYCVLFDEHKHIIHFKNEYSSVYFCVVIMQVFVIKPTCKTQAWLMQNGIHIHAMQHALTSLYADIMCCKRFKKTKLVLQVDYSSNSSSYYFGTNKIFICSNPDSLAKTKKQRIFVIFLHFLHEFRHWMQSEVMGIRDSQLQYTDHDSNNNTRKYFHNKYEIDARKFERKYVRKFMRYYVTFKRACQ